MCIRDSVSNRQRTSYWVGRQVITSKTRLILLIQRHRDIFRFAIVTRIVHPHNALGVGELEDHVGHQVTLRQPVSYTHLVADTLMALVLSTARRVVEVAERVKAGEWTASIGPDWYGTDVHHKTLGIVGMGRIGMALAQRAHFGFNMPILYNARRHHKEAEERFNARYCDLDTLLQESDFVCLILPLTDETHHLFGAEQFAKMKSSAIFINAGRGPVVDENALIAALQKGEIHAAGLDVFEQEPLSVDSPLLSMANVVAVPHIGSATHETRYGMAACAAVSYTHLDVYKRQSSNCGWKVQPGGIPL